MLENIYQTTLNSDLCLHYCGKRIRCKDHSYGPEVRAYHLFVYIKEGEGILTLRRGVLPFKAGDLIVMYPGEKVQYAMKQDGLCSLSWISVHGTAVDGLLSPLGIKREKPILTLGNASDVEKIMDNIYASSYLNGYSDKAMMTGYLYAFFAALLRNTESEMKFDPVERAADMMEYNYNLPLTVELMSEMIGCNPSYLSRAFKARKGQSPKEYLISVRMRQAAELLRTTKLSIGDTSASVGIEDPLYFSRLFHNRMGVTPSEYRAANKDPKKSK